MNRRCKSEPHGESKTRLYTSWRAMKHRCRGNHTRAKYYRDKGITYCPEWESFSGFRDWALANGYQEGLSIDRIDPNGNYEPGNCRWANRKTQGENKSNACFITIDGETMNVLDWAARTGISSSTIYQRYHKGVRGRAIIAPPLKWDNSVSPAVRRPMPPARQAPAAAALAKDPS